MDTRMDKIGAGGLVITIAIAVAMVVHLGGQQASPVSGDFRNAVTAEVRDDRGTVLLRGTFTQKDTADEVERKAALTATEAGGTTAGDAEVEYDKNAPGVQEIEFAVTGAPARAVLTLVLDGKDVMSATANEQGKAEAEAEVSVAARP